MGAPQIIYIILIVFSLGVVAAKNGEPSEHDILSSLISTVIVSGLLYWGGFFG